MHTEAVEPPFRPGNRSVAIHSPWRRRDADTLASRNPRVYKERDVGDHAVDGSKQRSQSRIRLPG